MKNAQIFKQAHQLTKSVIKAGDNYRVTFGLAIKAIISQLKKATVVSFNSLSKLQAMLKENGAKFGTAKNKSSFIEVLVGSDLHEMLKAGTTLRVVDEKPAVIYTVDYEVTGFGCEYNDYLVNGITLTYTRAYITKEMIKTIK